LDQVVVYSINDDFSEAKVFISVHTMLVRRAWLVDGPVVEWWVDDWVVKLNKVVVYSVNDDFPEAKVFISVHTMLVRRAWLVDRPIVEWWVNNWVLELRVTDFIKINLHFFIEWFFSSHIFHKDWVNVNGYTLNLKNNQII